MRPSSHAATEEPGSPVGLRIPFRGGIALCVVLVLAAGLIVCGPPSAEEKVQEVMELRNEYDVRLGSWTVRDREGERPHLYLDVSVVQNTEQGLSDLTVMVEQLDRNNELLRQDRVTLDVGDLTLNLAENVGVEVRPAHPQAEGIRLYVEPNPPREVWDEFPEFEEVRPRI